MISSDVSFRFDAMDFFFRLLQVLSLSSFSHVNITFLCDGCCDVCVLFFFVERSLSSSLSIFILMLHQIRTHIYVVFIYALISRAIYYDESERQERERDSKMDGVKCYVLNIGRIRRQIIWLYVSYLIIFLLHMDLIILLGIRFL